MADRITTNEIIREFKISRTTIHRLKHLGRFPQPLRRWRGGKTCHVYSREEVEAAIVEWERELVNS